MAIFFITVGVISLCASELTSAGQLTQKVESNGQPVSKFVQDRNQAKKVIEQLKNGESFAILDGQPKEVRHHAVFQAFPSVAPPQPFGGIGIPRHEQSLVDPEETRFYKRMLFHLVDHDPHSNVRTHAIQAIGAVKPVDEESVRKLISFIQKEQEPAVCKFAVQSLGFCKPDTSVNMDLVHDCLLAFARTKRAKESKELSGFVVRAIGFQRTPDSVEVILEAFARHPQDTETAWITAEALANVASTNSESRKIANGILTASDIALRSSNWNIRFFATQPLAIISREKVIPFLVVRLEEQARLLIDNTRSNKCGQRSLRLIIKLLEKHSGRSFGTELNEWITYYNNQGLGNEVAQIPNAVMIELKWLLKNGDWGYALRSLRIQSGKDTIDYAICHQWLKQLEPKIWKLPPELRGDLQNLKRSLTQIEKRSVWRFQAAGSSEIRVAGPHDPTRKDMISWLDRLNKSIDKAMK